ncbi:Imm10 family immunity protein [Cellulosimicrobium sp. TH-20]|uniref:Imm10 family immunity protein n=1 Tax=unclassified Cellulosimicrobium TaxID=2624466 RepID=UPI001649B5BA
MIRVGFTRSIEGNYEAIVLLDAESGDTIELQRSLAHDPQDARLGMDTYAIVRGSAAVHYGGLVRFDVRGDVLVLELDPEAARVLELPDLLELTVDGAAAEIIKQHLPRIVEPTR